MVKVMLFVFFAVVAALCPRPARSFCYSNNNCGKTGAACDNTTECLSGSLPMVLPPSAGDGKLAEHVAAVVSGSAASSSTVLVEDISVGDVIMGYTRTKEATQCTVLAVDKWTTGAWVEGGYTDRHMVLSEPAASPEANLQNTESAWAPRTDDYKNVNSAGPYAYIDASKESNSCPTEYSDIMDEHRCQEAAEALGHGEDLRDDGAVASWNDANVPRGCVLWNKKTCAVGADSEECRPRQGTLILNSHTTGGVNTWMPNVKLCAKFTGPGTLMPAGKGALYELVTTCPVVVDANGVLSTITSTDLIPPITMSKFAEPNSAKDTTKATTLQRTLGYTATSWTDYLRVYDAFVLLIAKTGTFWLNPLAWTKDKGVVELFADDLKKGYLPTPGLIAGTAVSSYLNCEREVMGDGAGTACQFFEDFVVAAVLPSLTAEHRATVTSAFPGLVQAPGDVTHAGSTVALVVSSLVKTTCDAAPPAKPTPAPQTPPPTATAEADTTAEAGTTKAAASPLDMYDPGDVGHLDGSSPSFISRVRGLSLEQCASLCSAWPTTPERQRRRRGDIDGYTPAGEGFIRGGNVKQLIGGAAAATLQSCRDACNGKVNQCVAFHFSETKKVCGLKSHAATTATMEIKHGWQKGYQAYNKLEAAQETEEPLCRAFQYDAKNKKCGLEKHRRFYKDGRSELHRTEPWHLNFRVYNSKPEMTSGP